MHGEPAAKRVGEAEGDRGRPHIGAGLKIEGYPAPALDFDYCAATLTA
jgi:hypothetical protein